ncbi:F-box domain-containing protein [Heracleum sosnowskyi]|uniref:F-box domain-containing protein n=1 Tax=Heracleum sosnowskyi TaxID=360622 RepID=A0AAD8IHV6_9APIA|nr:F-box domain-containing protein [Heracleum sosnowskyi]
MESDAKIRRLDCTSDRISNLPRNVIDLILEGLPIRDAARTSILSKTWRDVWVMHPNLVLDQQFFSQLYSNTFTQPMVVEIKRIISNILLVHNGPILVFKLDIPPYLNLLPETDFWIRNISNNGVRKLELLNRFQLTYKMPSYFFSCLELTNLSLAKCRLDPPRGFQGFNNLLNVKLVNVEITADMSFGTQLKELHLSRCTGIEHLGCLLNRNNNLSNIKILDSGDLDWQLFECIEKVQLLTLALKGATHFRNEIINLDKLVGNMPKIKTLWLDVCVPKSFEPGAAVLTRPISTLEKLILACVDLYDLVHIQSVLCLIRSSPKLRYLFVRLEPKVNGNDDMVFLNSMVLPVDMILDQLETVEILGIIGSRVEFQFIKILLGSTPSLRWIKLKKNITVDDPKEELRILRDLLLIPRASTSSQIKWE